jgi:uncharacterized Zn-finger protein
MVKYLPLKMLGVAMEKRACTEKYHTITHDELPLSCPRKGMRLWDVHPKVYLPIEETGHEKCPYCGTEYMLKDFINHA